MFHYLERLLKLTPYVPDALYNILTFILLAIHRNQICCHTFLLYWMTIYLTQKTWFSQHILYRHNYIIHYNNYILPFIYYKIYIINPFILFRHWAWRRLWLQRARRSRREEEEEEKKTQVVLPWLPSQISICTPSPDIS